MTRSIHATRRRYRDAAQHESADRKQHRERLAAIREEIATKRRIKSLVRGERRDSRARHPPPGAPELIPIDVIDEGPCIHYPASPDDLLEVLSRLPAGVLTGLSGIRLCLGAEEQEERLAEEDSSELERDPWLGRPGGECLPGIFCGRVLGTYWVDPARIELYAYVHDGTPRHLGVWAVYLRLEMIATFLHEVAHHEDYMQRVARGRWRADDTGKKEDFAEATAAPWVHECVIPYLEDAYSDEVSALETWLLRNGGTSVPLIALAVDWRRGADGRLVRLPSPFSAKQAFAELAHCVAAGADPTATRLEFACSLHYGEFYEEAMVAIDGVLAEQPEHPEAITLKGDIFHHQGRYEDALALARRVVHRDEDQPDAWQVLADAAEALQDWPTLFDAAEQGMNATPDDDDHLHRWFLSHRARANLELERFDEAMADLDELERTGRSRWVAPLRAVGLLKQGRNVEALALAVAHRDHRGAFPRAILQAVRFEAGHRLRRPDPRDRPTAETLALLRPEYGQWADRLVAEHGIPQT